MTDFLALQIDCYVNWKTHVEYVISKLSSARCVIKIHSTYENTKPRSGLFCLFASLHLE